MNKLVLVLILAGAGGGTLWVTKPWSTSAVRAETEGGRYVVKKQTIKITLSERGTLKTKNSTKLRAETQAKIEWLIDEGKVVEKDEVLVRLDKEATQTRFETLQSQINQVAAELKSAETNEAIQRDQNKTDVEKAARTLEIAKIELAKLEDADIPAELRKLNLSIEEQQVNVGRAKDKLEANRKLHKEDFVTENDVKEADINYKKALNALKTAEMDLANYEKYKKPMDLKAKNASVVEAERGLERARKKSDAQLQAKIAQVQQKKSHQQRLNYQHKRTKDQLEKMIIKAPTAGTVLYGDPDNPWMRQQIKVGAQVWQQMTLITLPDPSEMAVTLYVHEADIDKVKKGMKGFVTSETQKDKIYAGEVVKVDQVANAGRGGDNIKRFRVEVALTGENLKLKTGTSARVELQIAEVEDVLAVPIQAVHAEQSKYFCFSGDGERVEVELGQSNDSFVEIKKGLSEGDSVLLYDPDTGDGGNGDSDASNGNGTPETGNP